MINQILKRELKSTKKKNKIFDNLKPNDLNELVEKQNLYCKNDLVIDLNVNDWYNVSKIIYNPIDEGEKLIRCQKSVALKILKQLQTGNDKLRKYETDKYLEVFRNGSEEEYKQVEDNLLSINDVIDLLSFEEVPRIHFIMNGNKSAILCDAIVVFLSNNLSFSTSIYISSNGFYPVLVPFTKEKKYIWEEYEYTRFTEYGEGEKNISKKKHQKRLRKN